MAEIALPYKKPKDFQLDLIHYVGCQDDKNTKEWKKNKNALYEKCIAKIHRLGLRSKFGSGYREISSSEFCLTLKVFKDVLDSGNRLEKSHFICFIKTLNYIKAFEGSARLLPICIGWQHWKMLRQCAKEIKQ